MQIFKPNTAIYNANEHQFAIIDGKSGCFC